MVYHISEEIIAVKSEYGNYYPCNDIYIISIKFDTICQILNKINNHHVDVILSKCSNQFIIIDSPYSYAAKYPQSMCTWNIESSCTNLLSTKSSEKILNHIITTFARLIPEKNQIILFGPNIHNNCYHIVLIDMNTDEEINCHKFNDIFGYNSPCMFGQPARLTALGNYCLMSNNGKKHELINCDTFERTDVFKEMKGYVYKVLCLKKDIYLIVTSECIDRKFKRERLMTRYYIVDLPTGKIIESINDDNPETIKEICEYRNGYIVLTHESEINTYDCI